ncbi:MAG: hypothetical protein PCFJNLEI_02010 [Verrucomicrobiae bacterium]|nr:hypothetical protein [Verrucomicrobiae bacterium]
MISFSTCWNTRRHMDGRALLNEIRELGFEYAELGHGTRLSLVDGIQKAVAAGEIKISSLHNFCPLPVGVIHPAPDYYKPSSTSNDERERAVKHTVRTLEFAATLGAPVVVLHLGEVKMRDYSTKLMKLFVKGQVATPKFERIRTKAITKRIDKRQKYFDQVCRSLDEIVPKAREFKVRLGVETRDAIEDIPTEDEVGELIARYGKDVVGYWHDIGHAQVKENFGLTRHEVLLERYRGRTWGMHLQDFAPPAFDHLPPGFGTFDFPRLAPFVTQEMVLVWELSPRWEIEQVRQTCHKAAEMLRNPASA